MRRSLFTGHSLTSPVFLPGPFASLLGLLGLLVIGTTPAIADYTTEIAEVEAANRAFYQALSGRSIQRMEKV